MIKPRIATCSLAGCFGCHMSLLDIDERIIELLELVEFDKTPLDDKKRFTGPVDIGYIEGGCSTEQNVQVLRQFRAHCNVLISVGECAITGNVPAMRNLVKLEDCLREAFCNGPTVVPGSTIPNDPELPLLLDLVYPAHEVVKIDYFLPGCPPSADAIWKVLKELLTGQQFVLEYVDFKYE